MDSFLGKISMHELCLSNRSVIHTLDDSREFALNVYSCHRLILFLSLQKTICQRFPTSWAIKVSWPIVCWICSIERVNLHYVFLHSIDSLFSLQIVLSAWLRWVPTDRQFKLCLCFLGNHELSICVNTDYSLIHTFNWCLFNSLQCTFWTSDCCEPVIVWISAWGKLTVRLSERSFGEFCSIEYIPVNLLWTCHRFE